MSANTNGCHAASERGRPAMNSHAMESRSAKGSGLRNLTFAVLALLALKGTANAQAGDAQMLKEKDAAEARTSIDSSIGWRPTRNTKKQSRARPPRRPQRILGAMYGR